MTARPDSNIFIRFKQGDLDHLRMHLFSDPTRESFAVLLGKLEKIEDLTVVKVIDTVLTKEDDFYSRSLAFLHLRKEFTYQILAEVTHRWDVDTVIEVHTHPFSEERASFSPVDDADERQFSSYLKETFDQLHYGSIVLSQNNYSARMWVSGGKKPVPLEAQIRTQTPLEMPDSWVNSSLASGIEEGRHTRDVEWGVFDRSVPALGLEVMRRIADTTVVSVVGVGGLGSGIAEHLIHMGFHNLNLIDSDRLELSNMNRIVGAYYEDAISGNPKVEVITRHLRSINPNAQIVPYAQEVQDPSLEKVLASSDWVIIATDTHSSRALTQSICFKYFVPMIAAGVNITVGEGLVRDISGEVITLRVGDCLCLNCLGRIDPTQVGAETYPDAEVRRQLVERGYVQGIHVKEPAVKTLNTMLATIAVDVLVNQFTGRQRHRPIMVYENNETMVIYEDQESVIGRNKRCFTCGF